MIIEKNLKLFEKFIIEHYEKSKKGYAIEVTLVLNGKKKKAKVFVVPESHLKKKYMEKVVPAVTAGEIKERLLKSPTEDEAYRILKEALDAIYVIKKTKDLFQGKIITIKTK
jgi:hypothetical protein